MPVVYIDNLTGFAFKKGFVMRALRSISLCLSIVALVACGGGGEGTSGSVSNPLQKYEGTYYVCDGHDKETVSIVATGASSISLSFVEETYLNNNCSGSIVSTYKLPQPITATYDSQVTLNMPKVAVLPLTAAVDKIALSVPAMTAQLTGTGVNGRCRNYSGGYSCYETLVIPASSSFGGIYISGNYLVLFEDDKGALAASSIHSKEPTFNLNQLVPRP